MTICRIAGIHITELIFLIPIPEKLQQSMNNNYEQFTDVVNKLRTQV